MSKITLENMSFHSYHGCLEHEKTLGNTFIVTLQMEIDTTKAALTDDLADTLNYQSVYDIIKDEMEIPSKLIEHVAQRIADKIHSKFYQISNLKIKLSKLNPPLGGKVEAVSIEIEKNNLHEEPNSK
ncbi:MAG: dihydroneopterin aldolase [Paludibacter sp.]